MGPAEERDMKLGVFVLLVGLVPCSALAQREAVAIDARVRSQTSQVGRELARNPAQTGALEQLLVGTPSGDTMAVLSWVLRQSYLETNEDLKDYASKVKYYNETKKRMRESMDAYRAELAQMASVLAKCDGSRVAACDPQQIVGRIAPLEAALGELEAAATATGGDEPGLRDALQRNRQLIAVTRERLAPQPVPRPVEMGAVRAVQSESRLALAALQTFSNPMNGDRRLDLCRVWGAEFGQTAADAFCRQRGFARAGSWQPASDIGASTPTRTLGDGLVCAAPQCDGFASIACTP
jgi:hypothetical protein